MEFTVKYYKENNYLQIAKPNTGTTLSVLEGPVEVFYANGEVVAIIIHEFADEPIFYILQNWSSKQERISRNFKALMQKYFKVDLDISEAVKTELNSANWII